MLKYLNEWYWHIHHDKLLEVATEPIENRIDFIQTDKPVSEQPLRLKLLRKAVVPIELDRAYSKYYNGGLFATREKYYDIRDKLDAQIQAAHKRQCEPDCPWDGTSIFDY